MKQNRLGSSSETLLGGLENNGGSGQSVGGVSGSREDWRSPVGRDVLIQCSVTEDKSLMLECLLTGIHMRGRPGPNLMRGAQEGQGSLQGDVCAVNNQLSLQ